MRSLAKGLRSCCCTAPFPGASAWSGQTPALVDAGYRVHRPERRGHAHTPDVDGPLTYQVMADDTVAYLETAVQDRAHLVGWSDGAVVAVLVPLARPEIDLTELAAITAPTLVLQGDRDEVTL